MKGRSEARRALRPDASAVAFYNPLADGQAQTGARVFLRMQALEEPENAIGIAWFKTDAVIPHGDSPVSALQLGRDTNLRRRSVPSIFESVREEILEDMSH